MVAYFTRRTDTDILKLGIGTSQGEKNKKMCLGNAHQRPDENQVSKTSVS